MTRLLSVISATRSATFAIASECAQEGSPVISSHGQLHYMSHPAKFYVVLIALLDTFVNH